MRGDDDFLDDPATPSPWWGSRNFTIGVAVVALLVLATVFVVWVTRDADTPEAGSEPPATETTAAPTPDGEATTPPPDPDASVCGLEGESETIPTKAPAAEWELVGQIAAPIQSDAGPGAETDDGLRYCYQHSPTGALLAVTNTLAQGQHPDLIVGVADLLLTGDEAGLAMAKAEAADEAASGSDGRTPFHFEGFNFINYTPEVATIEMVVRDNQSAMATVLTTRWIDGDWKVVVNAQGEVLSSTRRDDSISAISWMPM